MNGRCALVCVRGGAGESHAQKRRSDRFVRLRLFGRMFGSFDRTDRMFNRTFGPERPWLRPPRPALLRMTPPPAQCLPCRSRSGGSGEPPSPTWPSWTRTRRWTARRGRRCSGTPSSWTTSSTGHGRWSKQDVFRGMACFFVSSLAGYCLRQCTLGVFWFFLEIWVFDPNPLLDWVGDRLKVRWVVCLAVKMKRGL